MGFEISQLRAGDIIFVKSSRSEKRQLLIQNLNIHGQRVLAALRRQDRISLTEHLPRHSHVMLGLGLGNIIHADGRTVALEGVEQALHLGADNQYEFSIFRRLNLDAEIGVRVAAEAVRYLRNRYDFKTYLRARPAPEKEDATQFCSRLVANAYRLAGESITSLPDHRVLPVDLWKICQGAGWAEVTGEFIENIDWGTVGKEMSLIDTPGRGTITISDLLSEGNNLTRAAADSTRNIMEFQRDSVETLLRIEALLAQYVNAQFQLAKMSRLDPSIIDDAFADSISRVLTQLPALLALGKLEDIGQILGAPPFDLGSDADPDRGAYAGLATRAEITKLRAIRETLRILSYLLMAETGLASVGARATNHEKFGLFRRIKSAHVERFIEALHKVEDFSPVEISDSDFSWVPSESDRTTCRGVARNIVGFWQIITLLNRDRSPVDGISAK